MTRFSNPTCECCSPTCAKTSRVTITHLHAKHGLTLLALHEFEAVRHALFIAFHYPPEASSSGVLRTLKYSRYLPEYGWRVSVITINPSAYTVCDTQLEKQIPTGVRVVRTRWINTKRHLSIRGIYPGILAVPDAWIGWWPWAVAAGRRLLRERSRRYYLLHESSFHSSSDRYASCRDAQIAVGKRLSRSMDRVSALDWNPNWPRVSRAGPASGGTCRTPQCPRSNQHDSTHLRDVLRARYPDEPQEKVVAILNGYDEADFANQAGNRAAQSNKLTVMHAGNINGEFRDPRPLLRAIRCAADKNAIDLENIRLHFVGGGEFGDSLEMRTALEDTGLAGNVEFVARVPYEEALRKLMQSDVLLLLQASEDTIGLVPAKLYEYLRSQKPVLALVWPGATSEILATTRGGWAVDPREPEVLIAAVVAIYQAWRSNTLNDHCADLDALRRFNRNALAGELAAVFANAVSVVRSA